MARPRRTIPDPGPDPGPDVGPTLHGRQDDPRDGEIVRRLCDWFERAARTLPWRATPRNPYHALVSEFMLQQTQVARVLEKFEPFLRRFPDVRALARAPEDQVLEAWAGMGYYRRARLLHACARAIVERHGAVVPDDAKALRQLPGVGPYTAGAIASIAFGRVEPIVDGNVCRVLQRLEGREGHAGAKDVQRWAWDRAKALVTKAAGAPGAFNEGLMELGATVCTPARPRCDACPLAAQCVAMRTGVTDRIPAPKPRSRRANVTHDVIVVWRKGKSAGRVEVGLVARPPTGLWAGMLQPPCVEEATDAPRSVDQVRALLGLELTRLGRQTPVIVRFETTHRKVRFRVWSAEVRGTGGKRAGLRWVDCEALEVQAISNAHRRVIEAGLGGP